ncbi:ImmA/IrrE family metallo-endopeptidase [Lysinibacillus capsici]|uniref:ImmA/IrrE family metallo-endopeptidase n=1 Tax=Lysinibacillus capsici TaxID=2115968 RepID=UPI002E222985|nr:ImmA/IrrE family metallo-endopeptidase [Lysinibacillus capsici]
MNYTTHTEDFVKDLYLKIGIYQPYQLNYKTIANALGIRVFLAPYDGPSQALFAKNIPFIFLAKHLTPPQAWQDFCHELNHILQHTGNQNYMQSTWIEYQEKKADTFMYHACMPTFMLDELVGNDPSLTIKDLQLIFNVEYDFAVKRLTQYFNNKNMPKWNSAFLLYF